MSNDPIIVLTHDDEWHLVVAVIEGKRCMNSEDQKVGKGSVTSLSVMFVVNILIVDRQTSSLVFDP